MPRPTRCSSAGREESKRTIEDVLAGETVKPVCTTVIMKERNGLFIYLCGEINAVASSPDDEEEAS